ncbi:NfeD family protein [Chloroflexota bacterium]
MFFLNMVYTLLDYKPLFVYPETMSAGKNIKSYALFCLFTTLIEEAALVAALLWFLPQFGITIPVWVIAMLALAWAGWSYTTYWLGKKAIDKSPVLGLEAMIGTICKTTTPLVPEGYVRTKNELWRACSIAGDVGSGRQVVIVSVEKLTLFVKLLASNE